MVYAPNSWYILKNERGGLVWTDAIFLKMLSTSVHKFGYVFMRQVDGMLTVPT